MKKEEGDDSERSNVALSMQLCVFVSPWHSWHMGNVQTVLTRATACVLFLWRTSYGVFRAS